MSLPQFKLLRPKRVAQAIEYLVKYSAPQLPAQTSRGPDGRRLSLHVSGEVQSSSTQNFTLRVVAGGTDLIPSMKQKLFEPEYVLDLRAIRELRGAAGEKRATLEGQLQFCAELTGILFGKEEAELIRRRLRAAQSAAA